MKRTALILAVSMLFPTAAIFAQGNTIDYTPEGCIRAGQSPLLQMNVDPKGELRAYFRRVNTTDWCSVVGKNLGPISQVVLPKFETGDEIEYFFVVLNGNRVIAKSPRVYRAKVTDGCESKIARHMLDVQIDCSKLDDVIPAGMESALSVPVVSGPRDGSPAQPTAQKQ